MIDNVVLVVAVALHGRDDLALLEKRHPLGLFDRYFRGMAILYFCFVVNANWKYCHVFGSYIKLVILKSSLFARILLVTEFLGVSSGWENETYVILWVPRECGLHFV